MSNDEARSYNQLVEDNIRLLAENEELRIKLARAQAMVAELKAKLKDTPAQLDMFEDG